MPALTIVKSQLNRALLPLLIAPGAPAQSPVQHVDRVPIPGHIGHAMAYDQARERVVMLGGGQTWLWNGHRWTLQAPPNSPGLRKHAAMVYDPARRRTVLFGGFDGSGSARSDTWGGGGREWIRHAPGASPTPRAYHSMAFDAVSSRVLLFGGSQVSTGPFSTDTWSWDGVTWALLSPAHAPVAALCSMASDTVRRRVVLYGRGQTWEWDGRDWLRQAPATIPTLLSSNLVSPVAGYDPSRRRVVIVGSPGSSQWPRTETWEWDGVDWARMSIRGGPPPAEAQLVFDRARGELLAFGGTLHGGLPTRAPAVNPAETWAWTGTGWILRDLSSAGASSRRGLVRDIVRGRIVSLDSYDLGRILSGCPGSCWNDLRTVTREWDGSKWRIHRGIVQPPGRLNHAASFDSQRGVTVCFGGNIIGPGPVEYRFGDTWEWDGTVWNKRTPPVSPAKRTRHAMAFDASRNRIVMFGGQGPYGPPGGGLPVGDTWEWNGSSWHERHPAIAPAKRYGHAMSYDPIRRRTVLYGGRDLGPMGDTWEWDGIAWTEVVTTGTPPPGAGWPMAFDPTRQRTVLYADDSLWEFDGVDWTKRVLTTPIPSIRAGAMVFDVVRNAMVVCTDTTTRLLGDVTPPRADAIGSGCASQPHVPRLTAPAPHLGTSRFRIALDDGGASAAAAVVVSSQRASISLGRGCTWYLGPVVLITPVTTSSLGHADADFTVPFSSALRGLEIFTQAIAADLAGPYGLRFSAGLALRIGD